MHANGDIERGYPHRLLRMSVVVSVVSVVSVSGSSTQREWTGAKEAGGVSRSRGQRENVVRPGAVARPCRSATGAVPQRDRRRAGNLALAGNAGPRTVNLANGATEFTGNRDPDRPTERYLTCSPPRTIDPS